MNIDFCEILRTSKNIAVVGISDKPERDSGRIAMKLSSSGYNVFGVHPSLQSFNGIKIFKSLDEMDTEIDIVDVFISSDKIPTIIPSVLKLKPKVLWLQLGIQNDEAIQPAIDAGITVIQNRCIAIEMNNCRFQK